MGIPRCEMVNIYILLLEFDPIFTIFVSNLCIIVTMLTKYAMQYIDPVSIYLDFSEALASRTSRMDIKGLLNVCKAVFMQLTKVRTI